MRLLHFTVPSNEVYNDWNTISMNEPTAAQKLEVIRESIKLCKVKPQFILLSKETVDELSNAGGVKPIYACGDNPPDEEMPEAFKIDDDGPVIVEDDRVISFVLLAIPPMRQAELPEEAIIKPRF